MIVTLTANPSLDRTITLAAPLRVGAVQQAVGRREDAAGKGINVARVIAAAGVDVRAVLPLSTDDPYGALLTESPIDLRAVPVVHHARANLTVADAAGITTKINLPGSSLGDGDADAIVDAVVRATRDATWLVLAGSLPPGVGADFYARVAAAVRTAHGARAPLIAVDTSGEPLRIVAEQSMPDVIKPNDEELGDLAGVSIDTSAPAADLVHQVVGVARTLVPSRVRAALITLGAAGAVLVTGDGVWVGAPPPIAVASTVGAGDSSLAGFVLAASSGQPPEACLANAIRYGAAAASMPGTQPPTPNDLPTGDVTITSL